MTLERFSIDIPEPGHYIRLRYSAPVTRELAREASIAIKKMDEEVDGKNLLADVRGIPNVSPALDNYEYAYHDMAAIGLPRNKRVAILINPGETTHNFPEIVMRNAGYNVRLFPDETEAIKWLKAESNSA